MVKALVLDYGGVLVDLPSEAAHVARAAASVGRTAEQIWRAVWGDGRARWNLTKLGLLAEEEHWADAGADLGLAPASVALVRRRIFDDVHVREPVIDALCRVRGRLRLALLSNAIPSFTDTWRRLGLLDLFEIAVNSAEVGLAKPDAAIFRLTAARLGLEPADCLLIDDQAGNVRVAEAVGMRPMCCVTADEAVAAIAAAYAGP